MLVYTRVFSSYSVNDLSKAKEFYERTLGFPVTESPEGLAVQATKEYTVFLYPKPNHEPATFTVLNLEVVSVDAAVDALTGSGVKFQHYEGDIKTDEKGIMRGAPGKGPTIAWFTDPAGNILSVVESSLAKPIGAGKSAAAIQA
ncbi:MAG TPA: VOC family protein [Puia sp.]|jgi:catechol 2,3-dioxygenase-like lactoylglutathione lyase family enzyme|nr:VOC family protein [Puia sp.]